MRVPREKEGGEGERPAWNLCESKQTKWKEPLLGAVCRLAQGEGGGGKKAQTLSGRM